MHGSSGELHDRNALNKAEPEHTYVRTGSLEQSQLTHILPQKTGAQWQVFMITSTDKPGPNPLMAEPEPRVHHTAA